MKLSELILKVDEMSYKIDMEEVAKFVQKNKKDKNLKKLIKKEFPKLTDDDIDIAIEIS